MLTLNLSSIFEIEYGMVDLSVRILLCAEVDLLFHQVPKESENDVVETFTFPDSRQDYMLIIYNSRQVSCKHLRVFLLTPTWIVHELNGKG